MHFYITGDTHRSFDRIEDFCYEYETTTEWYAGHLENLVLWGFIQMRN